MKKLLFFILVLTFNHVLAQSYNDGCMDVEIVATRAWNEEYEDPYSNDETNWEWWFADVGNYDGSNWVGGVCLAQGGSYQIGWWNHTDATIFNYSYGTSGPNSANLPQTFNLRGHFEGDDCGSSCDDCTSNPFDNDDYRYDETVSTGINYRALGPPNTNNIFQSTTSWHGGSDYGGEFYVNYTSPRPTVTSSVSQICAGTSTNVTFTFSGAVFGGSYVVVDDLTNTELYNGTSNTVTLSVNTTTSYRVYTANGGVRGNCYSIITIDTYLCNSGFNCVTANLTGGSVIGYSTDGSRAGGKNVETSHFVSNLPSNSYIVDIDVPVTGGWSSSLLEVQYNNTTTSTSVVNLPTNFINNRADVIYDLWWDNPVATATAGDPVLQVCACKTADYGVATVEGSSTDITICANNANNLTLAHNGSINSLDENGYGDELRWYSGSCGGTYLGSGLTLSIPSPTVTTTYYASFYVDGSPCRGANSYCESITVNVDDFSDPGTLSPLNQTLCVGTAPSDIVLTGNNGSVVRWEYSSDGGGSWGLATGSSTSNTYSLFPFNGTVGTHSFRAIVQNGVCDEVASSMVTYEVVSQPTSAIVSAVTTEVCSDSVFILNANSYAGNVQWQESSDGVVFTDLVGETSPSYGSSITNGTSSNIDRWYRVVTKNSPCLDSAISNTVQMTISPLTVGGAVTGLLDTICANDNPGNLSLTGHLGVVQNWLVQVNGGAYSTIANTNTSYNPGSLTTLGEYTYYAVVQSGSCDVDTSAPFVIRVLPEIVVTVSGPTEVCEDDSITLNVVASGGDGTYSFEWKRDGVVVGTGSSLTTSNTLSANIYNYTVDVYSSLCVKTSSVHQVTVLPKPTFTNLSTTNLSCYGVNIGEISISSSADSFSIDSGVTYLTNSNFTNLSAGEYNVVIKNANGCARAYVNNPVEITQPDSTSINFDIVEPNCDNTSDGVITVNATGGTPLYEYSLDGGAYQSNNSFTGLSDGTYTISVRDNNGCVYFKDTTLSAQYTFSLVIDSLKDISCTGSVDGYVEIGTNGGVSPFSYSQDNSTFVADSVFTNLSASNYTFYAEDDNGCAASIAVALVESPPIHIELDSVIELSCYGDSNGEIHVSVSGSTANYAYEWRSNGVVVATSQDLTGLSAGSYNLTVSTSSSCEANLAVTLVDPPLLSVDTSTITNVSCNGATDGAALVSVSGGTAPYSYTWEDASNNLISNSQNLSGVGAGVYTLTVADTNGCVANTVATISAPNTLSFTTSEVQVSCVNSNDGSITVTPLGGTTPYSYILNGGAIQNNNIFYNLAAGTYTIEVIDANGCSISNNVTLSNQYTFSLNISNQTNVSCSGQNDGTIDLMATGGAGTITYTVNGANAQTNATFNNLAAGFYTFEAIDDNGCSATVSATISENPPIVLNLDSTVNVNCNGQNTGEIYVVANGGSLPYTYSINGGVGQSTGDFTALSAGSYNVLVVDDAGCSATLSISITESDALSLVVANYSDLACNASNDGFIDVSVAGGVAPYSFSWSNGAITEDVNNLAPGTYTLTVTDANMCVQTISQTISEPTIMTGSITTTDVLCYGSSTGTASVSVSGGVAPYTYLWSTFDVTPSVSNLPSGAISVQVTDANGCQILLSDIINGPAYDMFIKSYDITDVTCYGGSDGEISIEVAGGTPPYDYVWTPSGGNSDTASNLTAGVYTVRITDDNSCVIVDIFTVSEPNEILTSVSVTNPSCAAEETGMALIGASGGNPPFYYEWNTSPVQNGALANNLAGDTSYVVTVVDAKGCEVFDTATLVYPDTMSISTTTQSVTCVSTDNGEVAVMVENGNAPFTYQLNGMMQTDSVFENLAEGSYVVFVMDNNNCSASSQFSIVQSENLEIDLQGAGDDEVFWSDDLFIIRGEDVDLLVEQLNTGLVIDGVTWYATGGEDVDTTACVNPPCLEASITPTESIEVIVNVEDENGCSIFDTLNIAVSQEPQIFVPNAFSPYADNMGNDCLNDNFEINILGATNLDVKVYNRWGELMFHNPNQENAPTNPDDIEDECMNGNYNPRNAWDGTYKGQPMPIGAYTYQIDATMFDGEIRTYNGTVTILR